MVFFGRFLGRFFFGFGGSFGAIGTPLLEPAVELGVSLEVAADQPEAARDVQREGLVVELFRDDVLVSHRRTPISRRG